MVSGSLGKGRLLHPDGENLRKVFLRSPLEFSRITSGFGLRRHPIFNSGARIRGLTMELRSERG